MKTTDALLDSPGSRAGQYDNKYHFRDKLQYSTICFSEHIISFISSVPVDHGPTACFIIKRAALVPIYLDLVQHSVPNID